MVAAAPIRVTATSARAMAPTSRATPSTPKETVNTVLSVTWEWRTSGFGWGKGASSGGANRHVNRGNMGSMTGARRGATFGLLAAATFGVSAPLAKLLGA